MNTSNLSMDKNTTQSIPRILLLVFLSITFLPFTLTAQQRVDEYVAEGLANNLVLKEKNTSLEQSLLALKDAKSYFLPSLEFGASYTLAKGGRTIDFPIGDLLNPVYTTLNRLTGTNSFPQLENVSNQLLPNDFYDARFRATLPLLNTDLNFQKQIRAQQVAWTALQIETYRSTLIQDIRQAYFMYCAAYSAHQIVKNTQALVNQNLKDNQALLENGKGLPARVLRAESEVENIKALLIEADNKKGKAAQYLNFLVNRPLDQEVPFEEAVLDLARINYLLGEENQEGNSELLAVKTAVSIQETVLKSQKSYWIPKLSTYADFGSQGFDWTFDSQSRYTMWGLQLSVPVFQGGRNQNQIQRGNLGLQSIQRQKELLGKKLALELQLQKNEVKSILATLQSSEKKIVSAGAYLRLVDRGFKEGSLSLIEYLDAQNQWTQASLQKNIATYNLQMALAQLERLLTTSN